MKDIIHDIAAVMTIIMFLVWAVSWLYRKKR
jgi:hypothetical protein